MNNIMERLVIETQCPDKKIWTAPNGNTFIEEELLSSGPNNSEVYKVCNINNKEDKYALKEIWNSYYEHQQMQEWIDYFMDKNRQLPKDCIVQVIDTWHTPNSDTYCVLMEHCSTTVDKFLEENKDRDFQVSINLFMSMLEIVRILHEKSFIQGNLSSKRFFVCGNKVKMASNGVFCNDYYAHHNAPEIQVYGNEVIGFSKESDVYSLGIIQQKLFQDHKKDENLKVRLKLFDNLNELMCDYYAHRRPTVHEIFKHKALVLFPSISLAAICKKCICERVPTNHLEDLPLPRFVKKFLSSMD